MDFWHVPHFYLIKVLIAGLFVILFKEFYKDPCNSRHMESLKFERSQSVITYIYMYRVRYINNSKKKKSISRCMRPRKVWIFFCVRSKSMFIFLLLNKLTLSIC